MSPENEWDATREPARLIELLGNRLTVAVARRIAVGYCRTQQHRITADRAAAVLDALERVADGLEPDSRLDAVLRPTGDHSGGYDLVDSAVIREWSDRSRGIRERLEYIQWKLRGLDHRAAVGHASRVAGPAPLTVVPPDHEWHRTFQAAFYEYVTVKAEVIRCVVGNPFRSPVFDLAWRTSTVLGLAGTIHVDRDYDRMPILADALEDAGCYDLDVLDHCRWDWPHARGCWVVELILAQT